MSNSHHNTISPLQIIQSAFQAFSVEGYLMQEEVLCQQMMDTEHYQISNGSLSPSHMAVRGG